MSSADPSLLAYGVGIAVYLACFGCISYATARWRWGIGVVPAIAVALAIYNLLR